MTRIALLICGATLLTMQVQGQLFKKPLNRYDENGLRTGKWLSFWDDENKIPMSKAVYRDGKETGVSKEYHQNGKLRLKFRYGSDRIRVKYFNEYRKLEQKGWSVIVYSQVETHYYWHGRWKFYDDKRKLIRVSDYKNGAEIIN